MMKLMAWWRGHGTKILGTIITVLGGALTMGLVPAQYIQIAQGVLTFLGGAAVKRGFTNSANASAPGA